MPEELEHNEYELVFGLSQQQFEEIRNQALSRKHTWRQKGGWLVCKSCPCSHAIAIGRKQMVGVTENGDPILEDLK